MKRSLLLIVVVFCGLLSVAKSFAQDTTLARIVYTNSDRKAILAKTVSVAKVDTLFQSFGSLQLKNLAILASTRDGKSLMIGGRAVFINPINGSPDSVWAIARIDSPFHNTGFFNPLSVPPSIGGAKILKIITSEAGGTDPFLKMLPLGVLSPDEKHWFVTPSKESPGSGNQWFFHGNFDGTGVVDSFYVDPISAIGSASAKSGYHMSNLTVSDDGNTMITVVFDQINSDKPRAQVFSWNPNIPNGSFPFTASDITGAVSGLRQAWNMDSSFAFALRVIPGQNPPECELALAPNLTGNLNFYTFRASGSISTINSGRTIARNVLPKGSDAKTLQFFTGRTGNPQTADDDKEVITPSQGAPNGNGGDMMFSPGGDSIVFVTCRSDDVATPEESGVYIYKFGGGVTLVQNDPLKMERQPIFAGKVVHKFIPPPPPKYVPGIAILDSSVLNFGVDSIADPSAQTFFKLMDTSASQVIVKSATFKGTGAGAFSLVSPTTFPFTLAARNNTTFVVKFTPAAEQLYSATLEILYQDSVTSEKDSVLTIAMSGTGIKKKPITGGVSASSPASFDLTIMPNPFTSSTQITVTAREAGSASFEIRDLLGKEVYSSNKLSLGVNEKYNYSLDANALHLVPGTYFVIVRSAGDELTRKVIYVK